MGEIWQILDYNNMIIVLIVCLLEVELTALKLNFNRSLSVNSEVDQSPIDHTPSQLLSTGLTCRNTSDCALFYC